MNYKEFYTSKQDKETITKIHNCSKHNKIFISFCNNCKEILCEKCLLSHDNINHPTQKINEIIDDKNKNEINEYKNELINLKEIIEKKIEENNKNQEENKDANKMLNSLLCFYTND